MDASHLIHLGLLLSSSVLLSYFCWWYFEWTRLSCMGAGVTIVCQINNVFLSGGVKLVMKQAGFIEGAAAAAAAQDDEDEDKPISTTSNNRTSNKKKRKDKPKKEE
jgi:hypothetical protein